MQVFRCPACTEPFEGWFPETCTACGYTIPHDHGILIFTDDPPVNVQTADNHYIGYDRTATGYEERTKGDTSIYNDMARMIRTAFRGNKTVLDLGSGNGLLSMPLAQAGFRVIAADISLNMLRYLQNRLHTAPPGMITPCKINAYALPLVDKSIDVVVVTSVFHLLSNPDHVAHEIRRVCAPGGALVTFSTDTIRSYRPQNSVVSKVGAYYYALANTGQVGFFVPRPGQAWSKYEQLHLSAIFTRHQTIPSELKKHIRWRTPRAEMDAFLSLAYSDQVMLDADDNQHILEQVDKKLADEFGPGYADVQEEWRTEYRHVMHLYSM